MNLGFQATRRTLFHRALRVIKHSVKPDRKPAGGVIDRYAYCGVAGTNFQPSAQTCT